MSLRKNLGKVLPVFNKFDLEGTVDEIIDERRDIKSKVDANPRYRDLLRDKVAETYKQYRRPIYFGKVIDSWDRLTSTLSMAMELEPGAGTMASLLEEGVEIWPKALYGAYYVTKTGDWKAIPYWVAREVASLLPFGVGDAIDMKNAYLGRASKRLKSVSAKKFSDQIARN